jgi:hypothetical protein
MDNQSNANNNREFLGLTQNECSFIGKVVGDPVIQNDNYAFLNLKTSISEIGANGQWTDVIVEIPCITMDPKKVAVIQKYVLDGRQLMLRTYYKPWVAEGQPQHAFMIIKLSLGSKKWDPNANAAAATPGLPVQ